MEANLNKILDQMRTASTEEDLKKCLEKARSSLDDIRAGYEFCSTNLTSRAYMNVGYTT